MREIQANESTSSRRRVYFHLVDGSDGITAETGEADGQPQISSDGAAWTNTGIGVLVAIGNGRYYATLTQAVVLTSGTLIETRYKSANTAESPGDTMQVVTHDPDSIVSGTSIVLQTTTLEAAPDLAIELDQNYAWSKAITTEDSQTGKDHVFSVYNKRDRSTLLWTLDTAHITVSGDEGKTLTVADDDENTDTAGTFYYELANTTDDILITAGSLTIIRRGDTVVA